MKEKKDRLESKSREYGYSSFSGKVEKRLDLNDLLKRAENEKNRDRKLNLIIFSSVAFLVGICALLILSF